MSILSKNIELFKEKGKALDRNSIKAELDWICEKLEKNIERFGTSYPSACATNGKYRIKGNDDWTNGFWTGMLWIAYEYSKKDIFKSIALKNIQSFKDRLDKNFVVDHHDLGFLYSLSVVAGYKVTLDESFTPIIIQAADKLISRFHDKGNFIQAWGNLNDPDEYRLIIDSLLNLPLLFMATKLTGDQCYKHIAEQHFQQVTKTIIREDASTYHTFYFDPVTGEASYGATHQGYTNSSCWARGQAWAILGLPMGFNYMLNHVDQKQYEDITNYFISKLSNGLVPYWDLTFTDEDNQPLDSSAMAIAACGLLEAQASNMYEGSASIARGMIQVLREQCTIKNDEDNEGILLHGVYAYAEGKGIDEPNLWGDYFYLEALYRMFNPTWATYW
ncbi:glycoside hydrolase family 88 protein [Bacillus thuringiensis]|uniref:glycoside hydrolase family 88 protein n=1 Tax=Bacillus thuringiensis TaxID=1428 RepID=UPI0021E7B610|nr:glycoside hydrolase family 88 protein [Bacillus thuringiensis]